MFLIKITICKEDISLFLDGLTVYDCWLGKSEFFGTGDQNNWDKVRLEVFFNTECARNIWINQQKFKSDTIKNLEIKIMGRNK